MPIDGSDFLTQALQCWKAGLALEAGRIIYSNLKVDDRPTWALQVLKLAIARSQISLAPIEKVVYTAEHPKEWKQAKSVFSMVRASTLELDSLREKGLTEKQEIMGWLLALGELVAKIIYNATNPIDEFDDNSGWWIAPILKGFIDVVNDAEFAEEAWSALCFAG